MRRMTRGFTRTTDSTGRNARLKDTISIRTFRGFSIRVPPGRYQIEVARGLEYRNRALGLSNSRQLETKRKSKSNSRETTGEALRKSIGSAAICTLT